MIVLRSSFPEHALRAGDVATLVDFVDHPSSGPRGCVLELFNALGESIGVVTVPEDAVEPTSTRNVLMVFLASVLLWLIGSLVAWALGEHAQR